MQNRYVSEEVLSICLANHSFINEIRVISFPHKNSHKIYIRYNMKSSLYILYSPILRVMWSIQGAYMWIQNFAELLMNSSCSKFPQKLYIKIPLLLPPFNCAPTYTFSPYEKNWSLFLIHQPDWNQSKRYDDLALSLLYRNVPQKVLRLYNNDGDFRGILSPRAKALQ